MAMGNAEATNCQAMEATMVVMKAPNKPVSKKAWTPSGTSKIFYSPSSMSMVVARAATKKQETTHNWRPTMNPGKL